MTRRRVDPRRWGHVTVPVGNGTNLPVRRGAPTPHEEFNCNCDVLSVLFNGRLLKLVLEKKKTKNRKLFSVQRWCLRVCGSCAVCSRAVREGCVFRRCARFQVHLRRSFRLASPAQVTAVKALALWFPSFLPRLRADAHINARPLTEGKVGPAQCAALPLNVTTLVGDGRLVSPRRGSRTVAVACVDACGSRLTGACFYSCVVHSPDGAQFSPMSRVSHEKV